MIKDPKFRIAFILIFISVLVREMLAQFYSVHFRDMGFSGMEIGLLIGAGTLTGLLFMFHIGIMTDRMTTRKAAYWAFFLMGLFFFTVPHTELFWLLLTLFIIGSIGNELFHISMDSYALKEATESRGRKLGIYSAVKALPIAIGVLVGGYMLDRFDFQTVMITAGTVTAISMFLIPGIPKTQTHQDNIGRYLKDFKDWRVLSFAALILVFTLHWGVELTSYSPFLKDTFGLSYRQMGIYMFVPVLVLAGSAFALGRLSDRSLSPKGLMLTTFLLSGGGLAMMALSSNVYISDLWRVVHEIGDGAFMIFMYTGSASFFTKRRMGGNFGLVALTTVIGTFLGAVIFSPIGAHFGYQWPHIICGAIVVACGFFILLFKK